MASVVASIPAAGPLRSGVDPMIPAVPQYLASQLACRTRNPNPPSCTSPVAAEYRTALRTNEPGDEEEDEEEVARLPIASVVVVPS